MFLVVFWIVSMAWMNGTNDDGTQAKWTLLVAGSREFSNYSHQSDICHAYHVLKDGGLRDENIIIMMYDDMTDNFEISYLRSIYNRPNDLNVHVGHTTTVPW